MATGVVREVERVDVAVYAAVARTPTPSLDVALRRLSQAADYSRLSMASAALMAAFAGPRGRRAAVSGLAAAGVTSAVVNLGLKHLGRRGRPDRADVPEARHIEMPTSTSLPSGHSAAAAAFATGASHVMPSAGGPLRALAVVVGYSRVHTGVHYPGDVVLGALIGDVIGQATARALARRLSR